MSFHFLEKTDYLKKLRDSDCYDLTPSEAARFLDIAEDVLVMPGTPNLDPMLEEKLSRLCTALDSIRLFTSTPREWLFKSHAALNDRRPVEVDLEELRILCRFLSESWFSRQTSLLVLDKWVAFTRKLVRFSIEEASSAGVSVLELDAGASPDHADILKQLQSEIREKLPKGTLSRQMKELDEFLENRARLFEAAYEHLKKLNLLSLLPTKGSCEKHLNPLYQGFEDIKEKLPGEIANLVSYSNFDCDHLFRRLLEELDEQAASNEKFPRVGIVIDRADRIPGGMPFYYQLHESTASHLMGYLLIFRRAEWHFEAWLRAYKKVCPTLKIERPSRARARYRADIEHQILRNERYERARAKD